MFRGFQNVYSVHGYSAAPYLLGHSSATIPVPILNLFCCVLGIPNRVLAAWHIAGAEAVLTVYSEGR